MLHHNHPETVSRPFPVVKKLSSIDSFRGWALLLVLAVHLVGYAPPPLESFHFMLNKGARGVQLFYLISAFSLMYGYYSRLEHGRFGLRDYFLRRLFRIAPLFWVVIAFSLWFYGMGPNYYAPNGIGAFEILTSVFLIHAWLPTTISAVVGVGWSVAVETMFYLILPFIFRYVNNLWKAIACFLVSLILAHRLFLIVHHWVLKHPEMPQKTKEIYYNFALGLSFPTQLPVFLTGVIFYFVWKALSEISNDKQRETISQFFLLLAFVILLFVINLSLNTPHLNECTLYGFIAGLLLIAAMIKPWFILDNKLLRFLGRISYSAYLWHTPILETTYKVFVTNRGITLPQSNYTFVIIYPFVVAITSVFAWVSYRLIEQPGIRLGEKIITRLSRAT